MREIYTQCKENDDEEDQSLKFIDEVFEEKDIEHLKQELIKMNENAFFLQETKKNYEVFES